MPTTPEILHYVGCDDDRGGVISVVRNLAGTNRFGCVLGVNPGCRQQRVPALPVLALPRIAGETISPQTFWRARTVARAVRQWLRADAARIFHGHSRAGLLVALWLHWSGERRVVASVHCYGRQRWFYRWAARRLAGRLYWLSPAMKRYYGVGDGTWAQCVPGCVAARVPARARAARPGDRIRLGGIGALVRWKNWALILAALTLLPEELRRRFSFRHIGAEDGSPDSRVYAAELRMQSNTPELRDLVEWCGQHTAPDEFLNETDCLVVASRNEPFSVAMLEALQARVPVLAADSGGARDLIGAGRNGWLFRSGDAADLARLLALLADGSTLARASIEPETLRRFSATAIAGRWAEVYAAL